MHGIRKLWWIFASCFIVSETVLVLANECDTNDVKECYSDLVHYEGLGFPFYGSTEEQLDETCKDIKVIFKCIADYISLCDGNPNCDDDCKNEVSLTSSMTQDTGLLKLYDEICIPGKPLRETYLENYECLETVEDKYGICHNLSQMSQEHMQSNIADHDERFTAKCCFFSWYQGCFTIATTEQCGVNATVFVSFALHLLLGQIAETLCGTSVRCDKPPLPEGVDIEGIPEIIDNSVDGNSVDNNPGSGAVKVFQFQSLNVILNVFYVIVSFGFLLK